MNWSRLSFRFKWRKIKLHGSSRLINKSQVLKISHSWSRIRLNRETRASLMLSPLNTCWIHRRTVERRRVQNLSLANSGRKSMSLRRMKSNCLFLTMTHLTVTWRSGTTEMFNLIVRRLALMQWLLWLPWAQKLIFMRKSPLSKANQINSSIWTPLIRVTVLVWPVSHQSVDLHALNYRAKNSSRLIRYQSKSYKSQCKPRTQLWWHTIQRQSTS